MAPYLNQIEAGKCGGYCGVVDNYVTAVIAYFDQLMLWLLHIFTDRLVYINASYARKKWCGVNADKILNTLGHHTVSAKNGRYKNICFLIVGKSL